MITSFIITFATLLISFTTIKFTGLALSRVLIPQKIKLNTNWHEIFILSLGVLCFFIFDNYFGRFFGGTQILNVVLNFVSILMIAIFVFYELFKGNYTYLLARLSDGFVATILTMWLFIIPIIKDAENELVFGITSLGNNDLPLYSQLSHYNLINGFNGTNQISPIVGSITPGNYLANFTYIGTVGIIDHFSTFFAFNVVQATSLTLMFGVTFLFSSLVYICKTLRMSTTMAWAASLISVFVPISLYSVAMGFIGSVFGISAFVIMAGMTIQFASKSISKIEFIVGLSVASVIAVFTYSQSALPILIGLFLIHCVLIKTTKSQERLFETALIYFYSFSLTLLLSIAAIPNLITLSTWLSGKEFGWKLNPIDPVSAFLYVDSISKPFSPYIFFAWIPIVLVIFALSVYRFHMKDSRHVALLISSLLIMPAIASLIYGWNGYQTWKMMTFIAPLVLVFALNLFKVRQVMILTFAIFLFFVPLQLWSDLRDERVPQYTSKEMFDVSDYVNRLSLKSININAGDFWPSMTVAALIDSKQIHINSKTYAPVKVNSETCTLVNKENPLYFSTKVIYRNEKYAVINLPNQCN